MKLKVVVEQKYFSFKIRHFLMLIDVRGRRTGSIIVLQYNLLQFLYIFNFLISQFFLSNTTHYFTNKMFPMISSNACLVLNLSLRRFTFPLEIRIRSYTVQCIIMLLGKHMYLNRFLNFTINTAQFMLLEKFSFTLPSAHVGAR